ncbi:MAG: beta-ketoacyl-ACP synthase II [Gammaproteobacteria bacterium]|nr:beta-ketoacyl-ACP synthase II [Gammaproteobacteria bacterium]MCY4211334.1 beta-ketoacyl-ACP synthase II [Gammaproteobacteria bacterium]MCY4282078.1 beta-ketoacyl-ACP synthase II [Gammaproteobacteria bacterium]MCY4337512.1 beta-ketoacyl-ACP synthase II [Gammaproteobacteria bacterium]
MNKRRVVITGLGLVTPLGNTVAESWDSILAGGSGIGPITHFDAADHPVRIAGLIKELDVNAYIPRKDQKKMGVFIHYGMAAGIQAVQDAGIDAAAVDKHRVGVAIGSGIGGISGIEKGVETLRDSGPRRISPFFVPANIINMISGDLSIRYGFKGPNFCIVTACATGTHNISEAARVIEYGAADVMVAGGAEFGSSPTSMAGFANAKALSARNDEPQRASRPWDAERDGFVLSDGAGVVILEEFEHARARGAQIYAELAGSAMNGDAYHMTAPAADGEGAARCMQQALADAGIDSAAIDYINAHGTSTPAGDVVESNAIKQVFGAHAQRLAVSSTKSMCGHMLGAAGSVEIAFCALALRDQVAPPTINLDHPDPACDLDYIPHEARQLSMSYVLSNSFGFGGTNGCVILKRI